MKAGNLGHKDLKSLDYFVDDYNEKFRDSEEFRVYDFAN